MAVELLERQKREIQSSNQAELSYNNACSLDSLNMNESILKVIKQYTENADELNNYEREHFHSPVSNNGEKDKVSYENSIQVEVRCNILNGYLGAGRLPLGLRLFRGTSLENLCSSVFFSEIDNSVFLNDCKNIENGDKLTEKYRGQIFTYTHSVSTSVDRMVAIGFLGGPTQCMLNIRAPKGSRGRCLGNNSSHPEEEEVLLTSGTQFRILQIEPGEKLKDIFVEVIVDQAEKDGYGVRNG